MSTTGSVVTAVSNLQPSASLIRENRRFTIFACGLFVLLGVVTTLLGPVLPLLAARWSISTVQAADLFFWQFASSTVGTLLSSVALSRRSFKLSVLLGVALCSVGVAALSFCSFSLARVAVSIFGVGLGVALPAINLAVAHANPDHRAASVSLLNFSWAIGAIGGPSFLLVVHHLNVFLIGTASLLCVALAGTLLAPAKIWPSDPEQPAQPSKTRSAGAQLVLVFAAMMFLFVGVENSIAGWASSLALPSFSNAYTATAASVAFWTCFLLARALAPLILRKISETQLMSASLLCAALGVVLFYLASNATFIILACSLAGFGIAPGFPVLVSRVSEGLGTHNPVSVICFACAGLGGAVLPPLVGRFGLHFGQPRLGLAVPFVALVTLYALHTSVPFGGSRGWIMSGNRSKS